MEDLKLMRKLRESIDDIYGSEVTDVPQEQVATNPMLCLKNIMDSLKIIVGALESTDDISEITSGLSDIAGALKELSDSVSTEQLDELNGAEGCEPGVNSEGEQDYSEPDGDSYPERNGFVG